jgi:hypothetical protein
VPWLASDGVQFKLLHALLRCDGPRDIHLVQQIPGVKHNINFMIISYTLLAKNTMGIDSSTILACCRRFCSSSFATHILSLSVLSNTKMIACVIR